MKRGKLLSILLCLLVVFFPSCNGEGTTPGATGSITVKIEDSTTLGGGNARGVEPQNLEVASYEILASGPEGAELSATAEKTPAESTIHTFTDVAPGNWSITINAKAEGGELIGSGTANVTVTPGQNASCDVEVKEIQGEGEINFNITDSTGALTALTAEISNDNGIIKTAELKKDKDNIFSGSAEVDNGFYRVSIKAGENEILKVDSVRIYAGISTIYSGTYDGETIDVTIIDEIIKTPDLTLTITSGASVAANGTLTASASVTNLESPSYSWYINGTRLENNTDSALSYDIEGSEYTDGETLEVTVFISNGNIIWSESETATVTEAVTLPSEVTISQDKTAYGSEITLSYQADGNIPEGTAATWAVNGTVLESATFTPSIIGHEIPVALTLNASGVTKTYTSAIEINPEVSKFNVTPDTVPEKAILTVESMVNAPESAALSAVIGEEPIPITNGKITLPAGLSGEVSIAWSISYNGDIWTGDVPVSVAVAKSEATEKPTDISDNLFAELTTDEKIEIAKEIDAIAAEACKVTLYETSDGSSNLDGTVTRIADGNFSFHGYTGTDAYKIWGTGNGSSFELTVEDTTSSAAFTLSVSASGYILNGESLRIIPLTPPTVNTDSSFGGTVEEKINLIDRITAEITNAIASAIDSGITERLEYEDNYDGTYTYTMSGFTAGDYIVWGASTVSNYPFYVESADVTVQYEEYIFTASIENGIYSLNGKDCILPLEPPLEPSDDIKAPAVITEYLNEEEMYIFDSITSLVSNSLIMEPIPIVVSNLPSGRYGNFDFKNSNGTMSFTTAKDISVMEGMLTIKSGSTTTTDVMGSEYPSTITVTAGGETYKSVYSNGIAHYYEVSSDGSEIEITNPDGSISDIIDNANIYMSMMAVSSIIEDSRFQNMFYNNDFQIGNTAVVRPIAYDMSGLIEGAPLPSMEYLISMQRYMMEDYMGNRHYVTTAGLKVTINASQSDAELILKGPASIDSTDYYFDFKVYTSAFSGNSISGGIRINNTWKTVEFPQEP